VTARVSRARGFFAECGNDLNDSIIKSLIVKKRSSLSRRFTYGYIDPRKNYVTKEIYAYCNISFLPKIKSAFVALENMIFNLCAGAVATRFSCSLYITMIILLIFLGTFLIFLVYIFRKNRKTHRLPPGPSGIPLFGYLPWINSKRPHVSFTELARKYGPICGLQMGSVYTVLLSDPQLVRQAFAKDAFAGRAPLYLTHGIMQGYGE